MLIEERAAGDVTVMDLKGKMTLGEGDEISEVGEVLGAQSLDSTEIPDSGTTVSPDVADDDVPVLEEDSGTTTSTSTTGILGLGKTNNLTAIAKNPLPTVKQQVTQKTSLLATILN